MTTLSIDFETRSTAELGTVGLDNYSADPTTDVWCMAFAFDDATPLLWQAPPWPGADMAPGRHTALNHVAAGGLVRAWNAPFEFAIWNRVMVPRYGWPVLHIEQVECAMSLAYSMGFPGKLEHAAAALGVDAQKDMAGHRLMLQMCRPRSRNPLVWWDDAGRRERLGAYCVQDVRAEQAATARLLSLSPAERRVWLLDQRINGRGFASDWPAIAAAERVIHAEGLALNRRLRALTNGEVVAVSNVGQLKDWMARRGCPVDSLDKAAVASALAMADDLPPDVVEALEIRQEGGKASTAKLDALQNRRSHDGRVRGLLQYHGAATGRWAGRDVQPHNLPRQSKNVDYEEVIARLHHTDPVAALDIIGPPFRLVSEALRSMMVVAPEGRVLYGGDFSGIESRGLAWAAGEEWKLDAYRQYDAGRGPHPYISIYANSFGVPVESVNDDQRQVGKVLDLAGGYQGGEGALRSMARVYRVRVPAKDADAKQHPWIKAFRDSHPNTKRWWYALEDAARDAINNPGQAYAAGPAGRQVKFKVDGSFLWCRLQSGRVLCYPYPRVGEARTPWGVKPDAILYRYVNQITRKWEEGPTYGGSLAENIIQAICRDLLAAAMLRLEDAGFPVVLHVHDEIICETPADFGSVEEFKGLMGVVPQWAAGWPISAGCWTGRRWQK